MSIKHRLRPPILKRGVILFLAAKFMVFGNCLGVLGSCANIDFLKQDYQALQINPPEDNAATPGKFGNTTFATIDLHAQSPGAERVVLPDPHSQVNSLLAPKLTAYAKKTQEQK